MATKLSNSKNTLIGRVLGKNGEYLPGAIVEIRSKDGKFLGQTVAGINGTFQSNDALEQGNIIIVSDPMGRFKTQTITADAIDTPTITLSEDGEEESTHKKGEEELVGKGKDPINQQVNQYLKKILSENPLTPTNDFTTPLATLDIESLAKKYNFNPEEKAELQKLITDTKTNEANRLQIKVLSRQTNVMTYRRDLDRLNKTLTLNENKLSEHIKEKIEAGRMSQRAKQEADILRQKLGLDATEADELQKQLIKNYERQKKLEKLYKEKFVRGEITKNEYEIRIKKVRDHLMLHPENLSSELQAKLQKAFLTTRQEVKNEITKNMELEERIEEEFQKEEQEEEKRLATTQTAQTPSFMLPSSHKQSIETIRQQLAERGENIFREGDVSPHIPPQAPQKQRDQQGGSNPPFSITDARFLIRNPLVKVVMNIPAVRIGIIVALLLLVVIVAILFQPKPGEGKPHQLADSNFYKTHKAGTLLARQTRNSKLTGLIIDIASPLDPSKEYFLAALMHGILRLENEEKFFGVPDAYLDANIDSSISRSPGNIERYGFMQFEANTFEWTFRKNQGMFSVYGKTGVNSIPQYIQPPAKRDDPILRINVITDSLMAAAVKIIAAKENFNGKTGPWDTEEVVYAIGKDFHGDCRYGDGRPGNFCADLWRGYKGYLDAIRTTTSNIPGLSFRVDAPTAIANGSTITYTISISYTGTENLTTAMKIPDDTNFVSASSGYIQNGDIISWPNSVLTTSGGSTTIDFPADKFRTYGFPDPTIPAEMSSQIQERWNYLRPFAQQAAELTGVDVGILGMWGWIENNMSPFLDNCLDDEFNPNTFCNAWGGNWQVGYGVHPAYRIDQLKEAMNAMRPGKSAQEIGQAVIEASKTRAISPSIQPITNPATFPNRSVDSIIMGAKAGDTTSRMLLGILMKDDAISIYLVAKAFQGSIGPNLANTIEGWVGAYGKQRVINYIAGVYQAGAGGLARKQGNFFLTVKPADDKLIRAILEIRTDSGRIAKTDPAVLTRVGNAPAGLSCPVVDRIPGTANGLVSCGSRLTPSNRCGHCGIGYTAGWFPGGWCITDPASHYAIDVQAPANSPIILPVINNKDLLWTFADINPVNPLNPHNEAIVGWSAYDPEEGVKYLLRFHHAYRYADDTQSLQKGITKRRSGEMAVRVCRDNCPVMGVPHTHLQLYINDNPVDAMQYFCTDRRI